MKKMKIGLLLAMIMVVSLASGCRAYKHTVDEEKRIDLDDVVKIKVKAVVSQIEIIVEDREDLRVTFKGTLSTASSKTPKLRMHRQGKEVLAKVEYPKHNLSTGKSEVALKVYLPMDYDKKLEIESVSGDLSIDTLEVEELIATIVSGDINMETLEVEELTATTISGDIYIHSMEGKTLGMESTSGCISGKYISISALQAETISGDIELDELIADKVTGDSISGDIRMSIPKDYELSIDTHSVSGDKNIEGGKSDKDAIKIQMELGTVSGDIEILRF